MKENNMHRKMKYSDVPLGGEWHYQNAGEEIFIKLRDDRSVSDSGRVFKEHTHTKVILIGQSRKEKK